MTEPGRTRRDEYSEATRQSLVDSARVLFADRGYSRTSTEDIVRAARVTKGALYHHFEGKQSLFEAVLDQTELGMQSRLFAAYERGPDPWDGALRALDIFVDECADTDYGRIVFLEGPVALGWPRWHECEEKYGRRVTETMLTALTDAGYLRRAPLSALTTVAFGMLGQVGLALAEAPPEDRDRLKGEFRDVILRFLEGLRATSPPTPPRRWRARK